MGAKNWFTDEEIEQTIAAAEKHRRPDGTINKCHVAAELGLPRQTVQSRLKSLAAKGLLGYRPVLPGFEISGVSSQLDEDGKTKKIFVQQRPARGPVFELPEGQRINEVSALVDGEGRLIQQWLKTSKEAKKQGELIDAIKAVFDDYKGRAELVPAPAHCDGDLLTVYNIGDHHHGMYSYFRETGTDYDIKISEQILLDAMSRLVASAPSSKMAIVLNLGDFFHSDSPQNRTEKSGHPLDVDTRWPKVLMTGVRLMRSCIELALAKHDRVVVRCLPGNHDANSAIALSVALAAFFEDKPRVWVDDDPSKFFFHQHGKVMIAATHGDMVKPERFAGVCAAMRPEIWGATLWRFGYQGHVHSVNKLASEANGMVVETFQTLAGKDSWHAASGYVSNRSITAITHHREYGEHVRNIISYNQTKALKPRAA